jgi:hypothetical protein
MIYVLMQHGLLESFSYELTPAFLTLRQNINYSCTFILPFLSALATKEDLGARRGIPDFSFTVVGRIPRSFTFGFGSRTDS